MNKKISADELRQARDKAWASYMLAKKESISNLTLRQAYIFYIKAEEEYRAALVRGAP